MSSSSSIVKTYKRIGYLRFGKYTESWVNKESAVFGLINVPKLQKELKQAGWEISLRGYLGVSVFGAILTSIITLLIGLLVSLFVMTTSAPSVQLTVGALFVILSLLSTVIMYFVALWFFGILPGTYIGGRKASIDAALPTVASYMSAMTSSGVPPAPIFASLAKEKNISEVVSQEAASINRDIEILGLDVLKALEQAAFRSPSEKWSSFLEGMIATVTSGGDLTTYLETETKSFMKLKQEETKEFIEQLGVVAEIFMVVGVVAPLFFVVMIAIISIIQSQSQGTLVLLVSITYVGVPLLMLMVIIILSTTRSPDD